MRLFRSEVTGVRLASGNIETGQFSEINSRSDSSICMYIFIYLTAIRF
jgi:hypothetical protein